MINHVSLNGVLLDRESKSPIRYIEVTRQYKDDLGSYPKDIFPLMMWSRDDRNSLFSYKKGTLISIDGRLEIYEGKIIIIVEALMYIAGADYQFNKRGL